MLIAEWYPVTEDMGLIHAPVQNTVDALTSWHAAIGTTYSRSVITESLAAALSELPPLSAECRRRLFLSTESGWTACFQSGINGSDPFPAMSFLAERLGVLSMRVCSTHPGAMWPATIWEVYAPEALGGVPPLHYRRSLCAANDGGHWVFDSVGAPFPFEDLAPYGVRRKRDRFDRDLLSRYLIEFQLAPFSDSFYRVSSESPAVLLESQRRWASPPKEFTLAEVRTGVPWQRVPP